MSELGPKSNLFPEQSLATEMGGFQYGCGNGPPGQPVVLNHPPQSDS